MGFREIDPETGEWVGGPGRDGYDRAMRLKTYDFARGLAEKCPGLKVLLYDREYRINPTVFTFEKDGVSYGITLWDLMFSSSQAKLIIDQLLVMAEYAASEIQLNWREWKAWRAQYGKASTTEKKGGDDPGVLRIGSGDGCKGATVEEALEANRAPSRESHEE